MNPEISIIGKLRERFGNTYEASPQLLEVESCIKDHHNRYSAFLTEQPSDTDDPRTYQYLQRERLAHHARDLGQRIDSLSQADKRRYVQSFCNETGFPNTRKTSELIASHVSDVISRCADSLGVTIAYSGFSEKCSVGKGIALPGSDLDFLTIMIRENDADTQELDRRIVQNLDPRLTDSSIATGISTKNDIEHFVQHLIQNENKTIYDKLYDQGWSEGKIYYASEMITNIRVGQDLINTLDRDEQEHFESVKDSSKERNRVEDIFNDNSKHNKRQNMLKTFKKLSLDEQFVIVRILQIRSEAIALDITGNGPHADTLLSLQQKGLLSFERDQLKAPWATYPWLFRNRNLFFYPNQTTSLFN